MAVVVAYNRSELLREVLTGLQAQKRPADAIVVVNNASTDDSSQVVRETAPESDLIELSENTGGAGGFAVGMAAAITRHDPQWVWVMDDDTVPSPQALSGMLEAVATYPRTDLYAVGSRVTWVDGTDHPMNTPRQHPLATKATKGWASAAGSLAVRSISFVSSMYNADRIRTLGYPIVDYFLWNDDFEFSSRMIRGGVGLSVPASVVTHKTKARASTDTDPGERFRFEVRNKLWLFRYSKALRPLEKILYGASSLARWGRTFLKSPDRATLRAAFVQGVKEARERKPRLNAEALLGAGVPADVLEEIRRAA
ncbi:glycosyltransferase [Paramicrobacterium humi]|uniref:glycosyltransferase n=1 Tax=Paramicrobacterium humi TaxID=640635 RepID=UPI001FDFA986|nr:glycosyltransferase [Microbacterium humi]